MKARFLVLGCVLVGAAFLTSAARGDLASEAPSERLLLEEKHFAECLAYVYSPSLWVSYRGSLYFAPKDEIQLHQIESLKAARSRYVALTNQEVRHELAAQIIADTGLDEVWKRKLLLPYSATAPNLTPILNRPFRVVAGYKVLKTLEGGDALIESRDESLFVLNLLSPPAEPLQTNLFLIKEGEKALSTAPGEYKHVEAFTSTALSKEENLALQRVVAACQKRAASLAQDLAGFKAHQDFEAAKARATDTNPYLQYTVARHYLEGQGTAKDEKLGLEWMKKAAGNGSGDAKSYLERLGKSRKE